MTSVCFSSLQNCFNQSPWLQDVSGGDFSAPTACVLIEECVCVFLLVCVSVVFQIAPDVSSLCELTYCCISSFTTQTHNLLTYFYIWKQKFPYATSTCTNRSCLNRPIRALTRSMSHLSKINKETWKKLLSIVTLINLWLFFFFLSWTLLVKLTILIKQEVQFAK